MRKKANIVAMLLIVTVIFMFALVACSGGSATSATISKSNLGVAISEELYGIFLEDISYACDGGLVSNLVYNNSFEYVADCMAGWEISGIDANVKSEAGLNDNNTSYLKLSASGAGSVRNLGYVEYYDYLTNKYNAKKMGTADMGFQKDTEYVLTFYVKNESFSGTLKASLDSPSNHTKYEIDIPLESDGWVRTSQILTSKEKEDGGLLLEINGKGVLYFDFFTLESKSSYGYGSEEWKYVSLRPDLYEALVNMSPSFIRFPGGCLAEGDDFEHLFNWKNTVGPLGARTHQYNIWHDDENGKTYNNTFAMGYHEYFQLSEDLNAEPLPILNVGMICQFEMDYNATYKKYSKGKISESEWEAYLDTVALRPGTVEFQSYIQDVLDLVEYANGDISTYWGAKRAENGHLEPFNLKYVGLGNENWGELYWRNFDVLYNALKEAHPEITVISSAGYWFSGDNLKAAWEIINDKYPDTVVDEHYYTSKNALFKNNDYYDSYDRNGAKVFLGEYAAKSWGIGKLVTKSNLWSAVEEASYLTGIERNGDIVVMASYAPTFAKINAQCWEVNLIWFDSQNIVLTPNYYTQMLFANNVGSRVVNTDFVRKGVYSITTVNEEEEALYIKVVNTNKKGFTLSLDVDGFGKINTASVQYISDGKKAACNELGSTTIVPKQIDCHIEDTMVSTDIDGYSINVIRIYYGENDGSVAFVLPVIPGTMEQIVTSYDKFYITPEAIIALSVTGGVIVLAVLVVLTPKIAKKLKKRKNAD